MYLVHFHHSFDAKSSRNVHNKKNLIFFKTLVALRLKGFFILVHFLLEKAIFNSVTFVYLIQQISHHFWCLFIQMVRMDEGR